MKMIKSPAPTILRASLFLGLFLGSPTVCHATHFSFEIEPNIGVAGWGHIKVANGTVNPSQPISSQNIPVEAFDFSQSIGLGGRSTVFWDDTYYLGLDFVTFPKISASNPSDLSWNNTQLGITLGAQLTAAPMRFWIGYNFLNSISPNPYLRIAAITDSVGLAGSAFKVGTGLQLLSPFWLNFEMVYGVFSKYSSAQIETLPSQVSVSYNYFFLSLSAPIRWISF
jgi:hypothetical protein